MSRGFALTVLTALVLVLPASAEAYSMHRYRVYDGGDFIQHWLVICTYGSERGSRFALTTHVEANDGSDKRFPYSTTRRIRGCGRVGQWYPDVLRYSGRYWGRIRVRRLRTDDVQFTGWRRFKSR